MGEGESVSSPMGETSIVFSRERANWRHTPLSCPQCVVCSNKERPVTQSLSLLVSHLILQLSNPACSFWSIMKGINIFIKVIHCKSKQSTRFRQLQRQIHADWNNRLTYFRAREGCEGHSQWACVSPSLLRSLLSLRSACVEEKNSIVFLSHDVIFSCRSDKNLSYRRKFDNIYTIWSRLVMHITGEISLNVYILRENLYIVGE